MKSNIVFSSKSDEWETPAWIYNRLNQRFSFTLDPCATEKNHKCDKYYTKTDNGLSRDWGGQSVFCNPPYSQIEKWVEKAYEEAQKENTTVVMLLPSRTDTKWFHRYVYKKAEIEFIKGRLKFGEASNTAPFPSMICVFKDIQRTARQVSFFNEVSE